MVRRPLLSRSEGARRAAERAKHAARSIRRIGFSEPRSYGGAAGISRPALAMTRSLVEASGTELFVLAEPTGVVREAMLPVQVAVERRFRMAFDSVRQGAHPEAVPILNAPVWACRRRGVRS